MNGKFRNGEKGIATLVAAVSVAVVIMTSVTMTYLYTANRTKYHARIKEAYKLVNATEDAAKKVKGIWDQAYVQLPPGANCAATQRDCPTAVQAQFNALFPADAVCPNAQSVRVDNVDNPNDPYCFIYAAQATTIGDGTLLRFKLNDPLKEMTEGRLQKFAAKVDRFFEFKPNPNLQNHEFMKDAMLAWLVGERPAMAAGGTVAFGAVSPNCKSFPNDPSCYRCQDQTGANAKSACSVFQVCPASWSGQCSNAAVRISTSLDTM